MRAVRIYGLLLGLCMLHAQGQPSQSAREGPQPSAGSISGVVADKVTGLPVAGIVLSAGSSTATTDAEGRYLLKGLTPATYQLFTAAKEGYVSRITRVRLLPGQVLKGIDVKLDREAIVAGRVLDRDKNRWSALL